jgi:hypothetical protein
MKNNNIILSAIAFFIFINTSQLLDSLLGVWVMPLTLFAFIIFLLLFVVLIVQFSTAINEKFKGKDRNLLIALLTIVISLTIYKPYGLIDFEDMDNNDLLIARREGISDCIMLLKLKENGTFMKRNACFGMEKLTGDYAIKEDTIWFTNCTKKGSFYEYGILKERNDTTKLIMKYGANDTLPSLRLYVEKNSLPIKPVTRKRP